MRREIVRLLERGRRLREVAVALHLPYQVVRQVAAESGVRYAGRQLDRGQQSEIRRRREDYGESIRAIAAEMGLPKSKVGRFARRVFLDVVAEGADEGVAFEESTPRRCPIHGRVSVWPCVACSAMARRG